MELKIQNLIDDQKCFESVRELRWSSNSIRCPHCDLNNIIKCGMDDTEQHK